MLRKQTNLKGLFLLFKVTHHVRSGMLESKIRFLKFIKIQKFFLYKEYKENTFTIEIEDRREAP